MTDMPALTGNGRRRMIAEVIACAIGQAASAALAAFATRAIFGALAGDGAEIPVGALSALACSGFMIALLRVRERVIAERLGQDYAGALRMTLFEHVSRLPARFVSSQREGGLALRFVGDLASVRGWISRGFTRLISAAIVLPATCVAIFVLDARMGLAVALPVLAGTAIIAFGGRAAIPLNGRLRRCRSTLSTDMTERLPIAPDLRLLGRMVREKDRLARRTARMIEAALARTRAMELLRSVPDAVSGLAGGSALVMALVTDVPAATAAGVLAGVGLMMRPMRDLADVWDRYGAWVTARDKCLRLLGRPALHGAADDEPARRLPRRPALRFSNVSHGPLRDLNIDIDHGRKVAILGSNGTGKTTLLSLAAGLDRPEQGDVLLGGVPVAGLAPGRRARGIALISPRTPMLAGSLRRALTMGLAKRPSDEEIADVLDRVELTGLAERLGGLDGRVHERGRNLSTGEIWRLLVARTMLMRARLLLIDSPDRALDRDGMETLLGCVMASPATVLLTTDNPAVAERVESAWQI